MSLIFFIISLELSVLRSPNPCRNVLQVLGKENPILLGYFTPTGNEWFPSSKLINHGPGDYLLVLVLKTAFACVLRAMGHHK